MKHSKDISTEFENRKVYPMPPIETQRSKNTMDIIQEAVFRGASLDMIDKLMSFHQNNQNDLARKSFYEAKTAFKNEVPPVSKDMINKQYNSKYTSIGNLVNKVNKSLSNNGLDIQWTIEQTDKIKVTCILTHKAGHHEKVSMSGTPDSSGSKNTIQQIKSTITYLKLATYEAVTGIASREGNNDDDGNDASFIFIDSSQLKKLESLAYELSVDVEKFCQFFKVDNLSEIRSDQFEKARQAMESKRRVSSQPLT